MNAAQPLLMDVDTGVDDALAILLALHHPGLELVGLTTVSGNCHGEQAALNTSCLLRQFVPPPGIPLRVGALKALDGRVPVAADHVHGADGLGGVSERFWSGRDEERAALLENQGGVDFMVETARRYGERLTVVATGPLTNLALAAQCDPAALRGVGRILVMGGAVECAGNVTEFAEFNVHCDPDAYEALLESGVELTLFPLDVTLRVVLARSDLERERRPGLDPERRRLIRDMTDLCMAFHDQKRHIDGCYVHDALPVAAAIEPTLFGYRRGRIRVETSRIAERGRTRWSASDQGHEVEVAMEVEPARVLELFWDALAHTDLECRYEP